MTAKRAVIGLISNPNSGHNRTQFPQIEARVSRCDNVVHCITQSANDIDGALRELARQDIDVLAINGGDGTNSAVLGAVLESRLFSPLPTIALLPGGTANMNAGDVGIPGKLMSAVERFCRWCESQSTNTGDDRHGTRYASRPLLKIQQEAEDPARYSMFLGGGAIIHGTQYAHENIHSRGLRDDFSLALGTLRTVWGVIRNDPKFNRHVSIAIGCDDQPAESFDSLILVVSTLQRLAFGMRPFWSTEPGELRLTLFEQGCKHFGRTFVSIIRNRPNRYAKPIHGYRSHNAQRITLSLTGQLNLDGEILEVDGPLTITPTDAFEFLQL